MNQRRCATVACMAALLGGCGRPTTSRFLALGDSYTCGESVPPADRWPVQLAARLRRAGTDVGSPTIIAQTGWTTADLAAALTQIDPRGPFDLVTLMIGVNNQYQHRDPDAFRRELDGLLDRSVALAGGRPAHVVVLSIPDWGVTPFAAGQDRERIAGSIDAFNAVVRAEAGRRGVRYVDVTPASRAAATRPSLVADDGLHPSAAMYAEWVSAILPAADRACHAK